VEKLSPEAAEALDMELAQALVDIKSIFGIGEAIFGVGDWCAPALRRASACERAALAAIAKVAPYAGAPVLAVVAAKGLFTDV